MASISAALVAAPAVAAQRSVLKPARNTFKAATVSNGNVQKCSAMMVWTPVNNKFFETFSYLPPLTNDQIARQVDYIVGNGWTPCLEFADPASAYVTSESTIRMGNVSCNYFDNRYWTMWKLPMFGCTDPSQVLREVSNCTRAFPDAYIRLVAFDSVRQVQITGFLVHRPASDHGYRTPSQRSV